MMNRMLVISALCLAGWACGGDDDSADRAPRTPESYVPASVADQVQDLADPIARGCAVHAFILEGRITECGGGNWGNPTRSAQTIVDNCRNANDARGSSWFPDYSDMLTNCLDHLAGGSCESLTGPGDWTTCVLVEEW